MSRALVAVTTALALALQGVAAAGPPPSSSDVGARPPRPNFAASPAEMSSTQVNRHVTNPVSLTWSMQLENDIGFLDSPSGSLRGSDQLTFQPTLPVRLTEGLKLITRPKFTLVDAVPYTTKQGDSARTTGFGDTVLDLVLSPVSEPWLFALGTTWTFPTANLDQTGQGKWQVGPGGTFGYEARPWTAGIIVQQWWSFAGSPDRASVSQMHLQYIAQYFFGDGWNVGTSPTIKFQWSKGSGERVTFPIGVALGKVVKLGALPVKLEIQPEYMPVRPDSYGTVFNIQVKVIPVVPSLVSEPLMHAD